MTDLSNIFRQTSTYRPPISTWKDLDRTSHLGLHSAPRTSKPTFVSDRNAPRYSDKR